MVCGTSTHIDIEYLVTAASSYKIRKAVNSVQSASKMKHHEYKKYKECKKAIYIYVVKAITYFKYLQPALLQN